MTSSVTDTQGRNFPFGYLPPSTDIYSPLYGKSPLTSIGDTAGSRAAGFGYSADLTQLTRYTTRQVARTATATTRPATCSRRSPAPAAGP